MITTILISSLTLLNLLCLAANVISHIYWVYRGSVPPVWVEIVVECTPVVIGLDVVAAVVLIV